MADEKLWRRVKAEYLRGGIGIRALAEKYAGRDDSISYSAMRNRAAKEKWTELRDKAQEKAGTLAAESAARQIARRQDRISQACDKLLDAIEAGIADGTFVGSTRSLRELAATLRDIKEVQGVRSSADMEEQQARIAKLRRDAQRDEQTERVIRVEMAAGLEDLGE